VWERHVKTGNDTPLLSTRRRVARWAALSLAWSCAAAMTGYSAVLAKEARTAPALLRLSEVPALTNDVADLHPTAFTTPAAPRAGATEPAEEGPIVGFGEFVGPLPQPAADKPIDPLSFDPNVRWFNGRPVRPARTMWMTVTGYSPDARSCGDSADGLTATLHSVETNASRLIAADPRVLPYGSMITVPGYDDNRIAPVLDCGGAIKGRRLDLLFPTHEQARTWGVKRIPVIVWAYADGKPAEDPRKER
jgi:3D (Asp-Asp-Asp) domain-containing protein